MAVSLQLQQTTAIVGDRYQVNNTVLSAVGIDPNVFVYKTNDKCFNHYAVVADMELYPNTYDAALQSGACFYRQASVSRLWCTVDEMNLDLSVTKTRLQRLLEEMNELVSPIPSTTTTTLSAGA